MRGQRFWGTMAVVLTWLCSHGAIPAKGQFVVGAVANTEETPQESQPTSTPIYPPPKPDLTGPVLYLDNDSFLSGELKDSPRAGIIRWQGKAFTSPFDFPTGVIGNMSWPPPVQQPKPAGEYCFELAGGDLLFGALVNLDEKEAVLDIPRMGTLHVQRRNVHRILRWKDNSNLLYMGPNGLTGWQEISTTKGWREEVGQIVSDREGTTLFGDFKIPARAVIEFELSWRKKLDFIFALGVDESEASAKRAFRFEAWGGDLIIQREMDREADLAIIQEIPPGPGKVHLVAFLDQENERISIFSPNGKPLADLKFPAARAKGADNPKERPKPLVYPGLRLTNIRGDLRLEQLRIGQWDGQPIADVAAEKSRIHRADGSIAYGRVTHYDAATKSFVLKDEAGGKESRESVDKLASVFLSSPAAGADAQSEADRPLRAMCHDGSRLGGEILKIENGQVLLKVPGIRETPGLPLSVIRSIVTLKQKTASKPVSDSPQPTGRLEFDGVKLAGQLADGREKPGSPCLAWRPTDVEQGVSLRPGVSGRIIYREPVTATKAANRPRPAQPPGVVSLFARAITAGKTPGKAAPPKNLMNMHLRTGDTIPCEVTKIDEAGVSFKTPLSDSTFVPHDKVKAVELATELPPVARVTKTKRDRLMTLPRMQKGSPPTHLIRSREGDYLRGRILSMDDQTLEVELRLEPRKLPRNRIARIIWLHADETDPSRARAAEAEEPGATRVQIVRRDGSRMTFLADACSAGTLSGKSDVLGVVRAPDSEVDVILFGGAIEQAASRLLYQTWKLQNAPEPKDSDESGGDGAGASGLESTMVGKPAPPFALDLLGGGKFDLAKNKGKVIVLDFWATWCGPCMQTMPQVDRVVRELQDQKLDVQLIAVNLQEPAQQITPILERHKLKLTVALDRDGIVANKYGAVAIPQTVIVQRDGTVARLFVGGGPRFENQFRETLREVVTGEKPKESETTKDKAQNKDQAEDAKAPAPSPS